VRWRWYREPFSTSKNWGKDRRHNMSSTTVARSEIAGAEAQALLGLVNYQEGSVVSRVVLKREKGNVTIFAFDEGQGLSEHTSPFDALVQAVEGEAEVTVAGRPIALKTGDVVLLPADKPHAVKATTRFKMVLTMIRS
jgi:quercetin dioxygenase-like cupin family protein